MALDPADRIEQLLNKQETKLRNAFLRMVAFIQSRAVLIRITRFMERGDWEGALNSVLGGAPQILGSAASEAFIEAAKDTATAINRVLGEVVVDFNMVNERAVAAMRNNQLRLVQGFTAQQRETTRQALLRGVEEGVNPREMARRFRNSIGLTRSQEQAVANYERALRGLDRTALERALRDKRFDPTVARALESGEFLKPDQVTRMVDRYRERMLKYRSEVIARTEALRSVHEGAEEMYRQAIDAGTLDQANLTREWNTAKDERVRGSHRAMHGQVQPFGSPFISGLGNELRYPGDPAAPPEDTIQCRCSIGTRMKEAV